MYSKNLNIYRLMEDNTLSIIKTVLFLALVLCIPNYLYAQDVVLYGAAAQSCAGTPGGAGPSLLYSINPDTGDMQPIGAIGFDGVTGLEVLPDGRLIGTAKQGNDLGLLIQINPVTGRGSLIGVLGDFNNPGECVRFPDLAYDNATDTLYATGFFCNGLSRSIFTIDPNTAEATLIGETTFTGGGLGLAMRSDGTLFHSSLSNENLSFYTINLNTGAGTLIGTIDANIPPVQRLNVNSMDFHPITGELFGSSTEGDTGISTSYLVTIDEDLPSVSLVGQGVDCFDALVFATEPEPIPALSTWGIMAVVVAFAVASIFYIRKRRAVA